MIDIILLIISISFVIIGLIGCVIPILPGPPLSYIGMLTLHFSKYGDFNKKILIIFGILTILVTIIDYIIPILGTKKFGGSKYGTWGATIGLFVGLFFGLPGIILGPFLGAFIGEISKNIDTKRALKAALGSFIGILTGVILKLIVAGIIMFYVVKELIMNIT